jgi:type II secretory pathway pseudopilin PulG
MVIPTRRIAKRDGLAFTLLELLLVMVLLLALLSALVFNFTTLRSGADLEEGSRQFEALIRFASAHAANNGRTVQLRFGPDVVVSTNAPDASAPQTATTNAPPTATDSETPILRLVWEPDPIAQPGVFVDVPEASSIVRELLEHIVIQRVQLPAQLLNTSTNETAASGAAMDSSSSTLPPISFFPDGSSDIADIVLASKNPEDIRVVNIHLAGVTGQLTSEFRSQGDFVPIEWMDDDNSQNKNGQTTAMTSDSTTAPARDAVDFSESNDLPRETTKTNDFPER